VVIGDRPLDELVPLYRDPRSDMPVTQFDMKYVEAAGLVKFDFLGLKTLSVLKEGQRLLAERGRRGRFRPRCLGRSGGLRAAPARRHGRRVPARIRRHAAHAAGGEADQLRRHHRARLALPAGADGQYPDVRRPQERPRPIAYPHPMLEEVLKETYGIFVYQEQVMQAAQVLAGYSLGEADCCAARWARRSSRRWTPSAPLRRGLRRVNDIPPGQGQRAVRLDRQVRRLRLQQEPRRRPTRWSPTRPPG
jgi:DNA polymerase-3 subunit alpha